MDLCDSILLWFDKRKGLKNSKKIFSNETLFLQPIFVVLGRELLAKFSIVTNIFGLEIAKGAPPATQHIRGSNTVLISVHEDRIPGRAMVFATLDNLVKGSAGQALQNFNLMFGMEETTGLEQVALFP